MGILNYECPQGHRFQKASQKNRVRCPECRKLSEILWIDDKSPYQQMQTPIVMWRYADGTLGVAGKEGARTPRNAERVEIRSLGDYKRYAKEMNQQLRDNEDRKESQFRETREAWERVRRSNLAWMMGQESDPLAKDLYREALRREKKNDSPGFREFYSVVMENFRSNYE